MNWPVWGNAFIYQQTAGMRLELCAACVCDYFGWLWSRLALYLLSYQICLVGQVSTGISLSVCVLTEIDWPVLQVVMTILKNANTKVFPLFCWELRLGQRNEAEPAGEDKPMQKGFFPLMWELGIGKYW